MLFLWTILQTVPDRVRARIARRLAEEDPEAGVSSVEAVVWTVGLLILAGIVIAAITTFTTTEVGKITSPNG